MMAGKKSGLGRGLDALFPEKTVQSKPKTVKTVKEEKNNKETAPENQEEKTPKETEKNVEDAEKEENSFPALQHLVQQGRENDENFHDRAKQGTAS